MFILLLLLALTFPFLFRFFPRSSWWFLPAFVSAHPRLCSLRLVFTFLTLGTIWNGVEEGNKRWVRVEHAPVSESGHSGWLLMTGPYTFHSSLGFPFIPILTAWCSYASLLPYQSLRILEWRKPNEYEWKRSGEDECNEVNKVNQMKGSVRTFLSLTSHSFVRSLVHVHFIHFTTIKT